MLTDAQTTLVGSYASIGGLFLTFLAYLKIRRVSQAVRAQSVSRTLNSLIDQIGQIPAGKKILTDDQENTVKEALVYTETFFVSRLPLRHKKRKALVQKIKTEFEGEYKTINLKRDFVLIRDDIFTINGK